MSHLSEAMTTGAPNFESGLCRDNVRLAEVGLTPESWFPDNYLLERKQVKGAVAVCRQCPVVEKCLRYAVENAEEYGIWGGTTEGQRLPLIRRHQAKQPCVVDGCVRPRGRRADDRGWRSMCEAHVERRGDEVAS